MKRVAIVGAGGHGAVVADILQRMREAGDDLEPVGFVDDNPQCGRRMASLPVLAGGLAALEAIDHDAVIVAVGDNAARRRLCEMLRAGGARLAVARHPASTIAPDVELGPGTVICAGAIVNPASRIGIAAILNTHCSVDHHNWIGDYAHVAPGVHLGGNVHVGSDTLIGIGATVAPQCHIGRRVLVGAGAVVVSDLPDGVLAVGLPARHRIVVSHRHVRYS